MINVNFDAAFIEHYTGIDVSDMSEEDVIVFNDLVNTLVKSYLVEFISDVRPDLFVDV